MLVDGCCDLSYRCGWVGGAWRRIFGGRVGRAVLGGIWGGRGRGGRRGFGGGMGRGGCRFRARRVGVGGGRR